MKLTPYIVILEEKKDANRIYSEYDGKEFEVGDFELDVLKKLIRENQIKDIDSILDEDTSSLIHVYDKKGFFNKKKKIIQSDGINTYCRLFTKRDLDKIFKEKKGYFIYSKYINIISILLGIICITINIEDIIYFLKTNNIPILLFCAFVLNIFFGLLHEIGHIMVSYELDINFLEFGIKFYLFIPSLYTKVDKKSREDRKLLMSFYSGGIYLDILMFGIFSVIYFLFENKISMFFLLLTLLRLFVNVLPIKSSDGYYLFKALLGKKVL